MTTAFYRNGTVAVTQNSKVVTGTNTNWATGATKPLAGDVFVFNNKIYEIENVISNTEIRLYRNFEDSSATNQAYMIMRNASLNISSRIAAQVAQVVNQKQIMLDEFENFLTNTKDSTVHFTDTLGNKVPVTPVPMLDAAHNQAIADLNKKADDVISSQILMSEAEAMAQADAYENIVDASGMVHMGKHLSGGSESINDGLYTDPTRGNVLLMGRSGSGALGTSKTDFAVTYIAGAISNALMVSSGHTFTWEFPQAEAGTRVYDSTGDVRGSGEATLDFRYDVDPKYGDVAPDLREAVGRAFEGDIKNGDFRNGIDVWGLTNGAQGEINGNVISLTRGIDDADAYLTTAFSVEAGKDYTIEFYGDVTQAGYLEDPNSVEVRASSSTPVLRTYDELFGESKVGRASFTFTATETFSSFVRFRINTNTSIVKIGSVSIRAATEEVVTHRSDLATWESYDEELTGRTEVFECIQSLSTTFGDTDVPTVLSTRPLSYFQQYDGQFADPDIQNDRYRCVVWDDLTDEQKRKVAAYMGNKLYVGENGYLVNRRLRARTFRGLGNGDWENIDSNNQSTSSLGYLIYRSVYADNSNINMRVSVQGSLDSVDDFTESYPCYHHTDSTNSNFTHGVRTKGAFTAQHTATPTYAYKGRCFLYVVASVPRANQGAYNPSLNPWGCNYYRSATGYGVSWYSEAAAWVDKETEKSCFDPRMIGSTAGDTTPLLPSPVGSRGSIASGYSAQPDGIFYDGITSGGLNGVIDWRLPAVANDSPEEQAKVQAKVENKTFRGLEGLVWTDAGTTGGGGRPSDSDKWRMFSSVLSVYLPASNVTSAVGDTVYVVDSVAGIIKCTVSQTYADGAYDALVDYDSPVKPSPGDNGAASSSWFVQERTLNLSVSGEFNTSMVIGDPANILQTDALKDGWLGTWCDAIPDGVIDSFEMTRKSLDTPTFLRTTDNGSTWSTASPAFNSVTNSAALTNEPAANVLIANYTAYAKVTEPCANKPVYNGKKGLMPVYISNGYNSPLWGCTFMESLLGKVGISSSGNNQKDVTLLEALLSPTSGTIYPTAGYEPVHSPLALDKPANNSPAVKVLPYQIAENEQCFIGYQANELTWKSGAPTFVDGTTSQAYTKGERYRIDFGGTRAVYVCIASATLVASDLVRRANGSLINSSDLEILRPEPTYGGSWGDDDKIKVTSNGSDKFVDHNGNTNLSVSHKTTMPTGWTKNRARIGEQVEGVDL